MTTTMKKVNNPLTAKQAIIESGLDFTVSLQDISVDNEVVPGRKAVMRDDTREVFGFFSDGYQPVQNVEAFSFVDQVIGAGEAVIEHAGSFGNGRTVFIQAKLPGIIEVIPGDTVEKYLTFASSHDGSKALRMLWSPRRVTCANSLDIILRDQSGFHGKHTKNVFDKVADMREILGTTEIYYKILGAQMEKAVNAKMTENDIDEYLRKVFQFTDKEKKDQQHYTKMKAYYQTQGLLDHPTNTQGGIRGTAWGTWNAVTYHNDHVRPVRATDNAQDKRMEQSWFGSGAILRQRSWDLLQTFIK